MKKLILSMAIIFLFETAAVASPLIVKSGEVKFTAVGKPGFLKIRGESKGKFPKGSIKLESDVATGDFDFDLNDLDTGIDLRNEHMKNKYLNVTKYPVAKFSLKGLALKSSEMTSDFTKTFKGTLTLHGVTKDTEGDVSFRSKEKNVLAKFVIKVSDFNIDIPKYLGITVSETVEIEVALTLN